MRICQVSWWKAREMYAVDLHCEAPTVSLDVAMIRYEASTALQLMFTSFD